VKNQKKIEKHEIFLSDFRKSVSGKLQENYISVANVRRYGIQST
jgi:hypothetical protein